MSAAKSGTLTTPTPDIAALIRATFLPAFPSFDQRDQSIQTIAVGRIAAGAHQAFDLSEGAAVIAFGFDWLDIHRGLPVLHLDIMPAMFGSQSV
jgi:hypothetical protein